jgi:molybdopterin/thiamine biosynthesis adenylyltransferase
MNLTEQQIERYSRHIILPQVGGRGQAKLLSGRVLIVGLGGLGSPAALYLAAAGVGTLGLADGDVVDLANLQRQIAHATPDVGRAKVESAAEKCRAINPDVNVRLHPGKIRADNARTILADYDFVIDGTDSLAAKFLVSDACHFAGKPYSHAGILHFEGQVTTVIPGQTGCYRCLFRQPPPAAAPSCSQAGVLGVLPGIIGTIQAAEAMKHLLGIGELLTNRLLVFDALKMSFREVKFQRSSDCPLCGPSPSITDLRDEAPAACDCDCDCANGPCDRGATP